MKRILFLTPRNPFPPIGGEKIKTFHALKGLSEIFSVDLVVIDGNRRDYESYAALKNIVANVHVFHKGRFAHLLAALRTIFNSYPLQSNYYYFSDVEKFVTENKKNYDLIYCNLIRTALYAKDLDNKKVLDMVDSIGQNYRNSLPQTRSLFWKFIYWFESKRLLQFERSCVEQFDKTLFVNPFEREYYQLPTKTVWTQLGVRDDLVTYGKKTSGYASSICFLGKMNYQPNVDAVLWFCEKVLPLVPNFNFVVVGAEPSASILHLESKYKNVRITGFVDDPFEILNSSAAIVAPMQTGAGVQNKVLEAMALGRPVIVSSLAAKAIVGAKNHEHFFVEDRPEEIAKIINGLPSLKAEAVGSQARKFISENYSWKSYGKNLASTIQHILGDA